MHTACKWTPKRAPGLDQLARIHVRTRGSPTKAQGSSDVGIPGPRPELDDNQVLGSQRPFGPANPVDTAQIAS